MSTVFKTFTVSAAAAVLTLGTAGAVVAVGAGPADASSSATYCDVAFCVTFEPVGPGIVTVVAAPRETFFGFFQLRTPNRRAIDSTTKTWQPPDLAVFRDIDGGSGLYCLAAWKLAGPAVTELGSICVDVP